MNSVIGSREVERFRAALGQRVGLLFEDSRVELLRALLERRCEAAGGSSEKYLELLESNLPLREELSALAPHITVSETYFFRHFDQFRAFTEVALPARLAARASTRKLAILSAGCSSGEEAFSLAMLIHDCVSEGSAHEAWDVSIRGVDINPLILEKAARGRYGAWALRETPPEMRQRWFHAERDEYVLDPRIQRAVWFEQRNLIQANADLWLPGLYDVVFFRNVLMYLTPEHARAVVARIALALAPGGFLFVGHAETLRGLSHDFHLRHTHETFYYERKSSADADEDDHGPRERGAPAKVPSVPAPSTWVQEIDHASQRIDVLLSSARELLRDDCFAQGLGELQRLAVVDSDNADAMLLRAALFAHSGKFEEAQQACQKLLALDDLSAGAHYVLALCREGLGDMAGAIEHDQVAVYLDPAFAMPRLHLGLLARRAGDRSTSRRELSQALSMLEGEDASRILLFGGGFSREALLMLCRKELLACEGRA